MKKRFLSLVLGFLVGITGMTGQNQENEVITYSEEMSVSLQEATQYALQHNHNLRNASLDVKIAEAQRWQTIAAMLPQADMQMVYQNMCGYEMNMKGFSIPMNPNGTMSVNASIALNGQMVVGALLNNVAVDMQRINRDEKEVSLVVDVENMYLTILAMEKTLAVLDSSKANLSALYQMTAGAVEVGAAEQTDADQLEVQVASLESSIKSTQRSIALLYNSLAYSMGVGSDVRIVLTDKLEDVLNVEAAVNLLHADFDITKNNTYKLAEKNLELAEKNVIMAGMAYIPTLSAYYQYSAKTYFGEDEGMNMTPPNVVGVTLSVPLWSSGKRAAGVHEKRIARTQAENTLADSKDAIELAYRQAKYNLINAYENYDIQRKNIDVTDRVMKSTSNKYQYGRVSALDLTTANTNLLNANSNYIQAIVTLLNAQMALKNLLDVK